MSDVHVCDECSFCQARSGFLRTRHECMNLNAKRHGVIKQNDKACELFKAKPQFEGLGLMKALSKGASESVQVMKGERSVQRRVDLGSSKPGATAPEQAAPAASGQAAPQPITLARSQSPAAQSPAPSAGLKVGCDVHTHTLYSRHAYATIEENVRAAAERGLELLGSTDHFSSMLYSEARELERAQGYDLRDYQYFINYVCWPREWHGVHVLHGCEADIVDLDGSLFGHNVPVDYLISGTKRSRQTTLRRSVFSQCDYVIASVHDKSFAEGATPAQAAEMYIRALEQPKVLILGHVGRAGVPFEIDPVLQAAKDLGRLIEINGATLHSHKDAIAQCRLIAERCAELGTMISTGSDAHISTAVGDFAGVRAFLEEIDFPQELIATADAQTFLGALDRARELTA